MQVLTAAGGLYCCVTVGMMLVTYCCCRKYSDHDKYAKDRFAYAEYMVSSSYIDDQVSSK